MIDDEMKAAHEQLHFEDIDKDGFGKHITPTAQNYQQLFVQDKQYLVTRLITEHSRAAVLESQVKRYLSIIRDMKKLCQAMAVELDEE